MLVNAGRRALGKVRGHWGILLACVLWDFTGQQAHAQQPSLDYQVKAAMVYKFLGYTTWPSSRFPNEHSPYRICVIGSDDITNELRNIVAHRQIEGRAIEIYSADTIAHIGDAHLVFVSKAMEPLLPSLVPVAKKLSYLIVSDNEHGLIDGSAINLRLVDNRIGFDISLPATRAYGLTVSSRLLSVAVTVTEERD